jgi:hypothetical protein
MNRTSSGVCVLLSFLAPVMLGGCSSEPTPPPRFQLDPQKAAQEALRLYDKNQDGTLDAKELEQSAPLMELLQNLKAANPSHADSLTAADISARLDQWLAAPATLLPAGAVVYLDDKALAGATVVYDPEPFLGPSYRSHQGQTNDAGGVTLDPEFKDFPGIYVGLYRVRISKKVDGKETIPERYNEKSVLGVELATNVRNSRSNGTIRLKSK